MKKDNRATAAGHQTPAATELKHGGARENSGRKTSRPVNKKQAFYLFCDQHPLTGVEVRQAVDAYLSTRRETPKKQAK